MKHYPFGGSTATRTLACPAWRNLSKGIPKGPASDVAQQGTAMHWLFEQSVNDYDFDPADYIGKHVEGVEITNDMVVRKVYPAIDMADALSDKYELDTIHTEVLMEAEDDDIGGSADMVGWSEKTNTFICGDLKTGDGHIVKAADNAQGMFYTGLAMRHFAKHFKFNINTKILIAIFQPTDRRDDPLDVWETDLVTIKAFMQRFKQAVKVSKSGDMNPNPGKHCSYCPAAALCPAKTGLVQASLRIKVDSKDMVALNDGMEIVEAVEAWCRDIRKLAHEQAEQGVKIDGWKLVNKRGRRMWNDAPAVEQKLKNMRKLTAPDYYTQTLLTAPALEKICKQKKVDFKQFEEYISNVSSGTTMAHDSDKRPEAVAIKALQQMASQLQ